MSLMMTNLQKELKEAKASRDWAYKQRMKANPNRTMQSMEAERNWHDQAEQRVRSIEEQIAALQEREEQERLQRAAEKTSREKLLLEKVTKLESMLTAQRGGQRELFDIKCAACGKQTQVPVRTAQYCRDCYKGRKR